MNEAVQEAKRSKPTLYSWIHQGLIESFVSKSRPDSTTGVRLIRRRSLRDFLEKQFREAQVEPPVVRSAGPLRPGKLRPAGHGAIWKQKAFLEAFKATHAKDKI
jgi:hypothetical protein